MTAQDYQMKNKLAGGTRARAFSGAVPGWWDVVLTEGESLDCCLLQIVLFRWPLRLPGFLLKTLGGVAEWRNVCFVSRRFQIQILASAGRAGAKVQWWNAGATHAGAEHTKWVHLILM